MNLMIGALQGGFRWVVLTSVMASLLIGLVLMVRTLFRERLGAQWQYALWILVVLRLALPWLPSSSFSVYNILPVQHPNTISTSSPTSPSTGPQLTVEWEAGTWLTTESDQLGAAGPATQHPVQWPNLTTVVDYLAWVWLAGVVVLIGRTWHTNRRFARRVANGSEVEDPLTRELFAHCCQEMAASRPVMLVETPAVKSPALYGALRPQLLVPLHLHETLGSSQLRYTFLHELTHLKRKDIAVSWMMNLLVILHWFNPLIAYAFTCMREDQELACDASVLTFVESEDPTEYAHTIISMLEHFAASPQLPVLAGITSKKSQIKRRLTMINLFKGRSWAWSAIGIVIVVTLAVVALTNGKNLVAADPANGITPPLVTAPAPTTSSPADANSILYKNAQYGFNFTLPKDWNGYSIISSQWQGLAIIGQSGQSVADTGPIISIRDPRWTSQTPRQDIPIMVFTRDQWNSLQQGVFHIGAAPIGPSELGRNNVYVFALPARYNFAFPAGFEEVETILAGKPLQVADNLAPITSSTPQSDASKELITSIMQLAEQGKALGIEFPAKTNVLDNVEQKWGKADKQDWVPEAKGTYVTYASRGAVFGFNKGMQIFEVRTFDSQLKQLSLSQVKAVLGAPAYDVQSNGEEIIGYVASPEFRVLLVFPQAAGNANPVLDHYSVLYPRGTVNMMADDPGRQW